MILKQKKEDKKIAEYNEEELAVSKAQFKKFEE